MDIINDDWIKKEMIKGFWNEEQPAQRLKILELYDRDQRSIIFILCGKPPRGYAIYQPDYHFIIFIDAWGEKIATYRNIEYTTEEDIIDD